MRCYGSTQKWVRSAFWSGLPVLACGGLGCAWWAVRGSGAGQGDTAAASSCAVLFDRYCVWCVRSFTVGFACYCGSPPAAHKQSCYNGPVL